VRLQTGLGARLAAILLQTGRLAPANSSVDRVAIWPAIELAVVASATELAEEQA